MLPSSVVRALALGVSVVVTLCLLHCSSNRAFRVLLGKEDFIIMTSFLLANPQGMPLLMPASE